MTPVGARCSPTGAVEPNLSLDVTARGAGERLRSVLPHVMHQQHARRIPLRRMHAARRHRRWHERQAAARHGRSPSRLEHRSPARRPRRSLLQQLHLESLKEKETDLFNLTGTRPLFEQFQQRGCIGRSLFKISRQALQYDMRKPRVAAFIKPRDLALENSK